MSYELLSQAFANGDVIYGLDQPRATALQALGRARTRAIGKVYLGCIPGGTVQKRVALIQNDVTNAVWDPIAKPNAYSSNKSIKRALQLDPIRR